MPVMSLIPGLLLYWPDHVTMVNWGDKMNNQEAKAPPASNNNKDTIVYINQTQKMF